MTSYRMKINFIINPRPDLSQCKFDNKTEKLCLELKNLFAVHRDCNHIIHGPFFFTCPSVFSNMI